MKCVIIAKELRGYFMNKNFIPRDTIHYARLYVLHLCTAIVENLDFLQITNTRRFGPR